MFRVLTPGGRLLLDLPRPIQYWPSSPILAGALERHMGSASAAMMNAPFALSNAEEMRTLIAGAGFQDVRIRIAIETLRAPSPEEFVWRQSVGSPLVGRFAKISYEAKSALISAVSVALQSYVDDDGMVHPMEAYSQLHIDRPFMRMRFSGRSGSDRDGALNSLRQRQHMIKIAFLADFPEAIPTLTYWFRAHWPVYFAERTRADIAGVSGRKQTTGPTTPTPGGLRQR